MYLTEIRLLPITLARLEGFNYPGDIGPAQQFFEHLLTTVAPKFSRGYLCFSDKAKIGLGTDLQMKWRQQLAQQPNLLDGL